MKNIYLNNPSPDDFTEDPTDEELQRIEEELDKYSD